MKQFVLPLTFLVLVQLFNSAECNSATVCMWKVCSQIGNRQCRPVVSLVISNRYSGTITGDLVNESVNANFNTRKCSGDQVFCLQTFPNSYDVQLFYGNRRIDLMGSRRARDMNSGCQRSHNGPSEWWLDL